MEAVIVVSTQKGNSVRFQVFMAVITKITTFWDVVPWCHVTWYKFTNVVKEHAASVFRVIYCSSTFP